MSYIPQEWKDLPDETTPYNSSRMEHIEEGINVAANTIEITEANTDLNDYVNQGMYYFGPDYTPRNIPVGLNGWLVALEKNPYTKQIWFRMGTLNSNDHDMYVRTSNGREWSNWIKVITKKDLDNVQTDLEYYKVGDTISVANTQFAGCLTGSQAQIRFAIPVRKSMKNVIPNVSGTITTRAGNGGYVTNGADISSFTVSLLKTGDNNILRFVLTASEAYTSFTNNQALAVEFAGTITFS